MALPYYFYYGKYIRPYLNKPEKKSYTVLALTLLTILFFGGFALAPTIKSITKVKKDVEFLESLVDKLSLKLENLEEARLAYAKSSEYFSLLDTQIFEFDGWGKDIYALQDIARQNDVTIKIINPRGGKGDSLEVAFFGEYIQVKNYLEQIDRQRVGYDLSSISISRITNKKEDNSLLLVSDTIVEAKAVFNIVHL